MNKIREHQFSKLINIISIYKNVTNPANLQLFSKTEIPSIMFTLIFNHLTSSCILVFYNNNMGHVVANTILISVLCHGYGGSFIAVSAHGASMVNNIIILLLIRRVSK